MSKRPVLYRRSSRLPGYDYRSTGAYFVTICAWQKRPIFGGEVLRRIAEETWKEIPNHFQHALVDAFVVMPNHVHGIVFIERNAVGAQHAAPLRGSGLQPGSLGAIVRSFKSAVTKRVGEQGSIDGSVWRRNYYERVIRNEGELNRVREYVILNPVRWQFDRENPGRLADPAYEREWAWLEAVTITVPAKNVPPV